MEDKLNIWELRKLLTSYEDGNLEYIVNDYQKINYGQNTLKLRKERDGNIYAFINNDEFGECCLCQIKTKEQLINLKNSLLGLSSK